MPVKYRDCEVKEKLGEITTFISLRDVTVLMSSKSEILLIECLTMKNKLNFETSNYFKQKCKI